MQRYTTFFAGCCRYLLLFFYWWVSQVSKSYVEAVLATHPAYDVQRLAVLPEDAVYVTEYKVFPADPLEVQNYQEKLEEYFDKRRSGNAERTEFNKLSVTTKIKLAQRDALAGGPVITNAHVIDHEHISWCMLNVNPLDLKAHQQYRSIWTLVNKRFFGAILRSVHLTNIPLSPFVFHRFSANCKHVETVLVTRLE